MTELAKPEKVQLWTLEEAATFLNVSKETVRLRALDKTIPSCRIGRLVRFDPDLLRGWVRDQSSVQSGTTASQPEGDERRAPGADSAGETMILIEKGLTGYLLKRGDTGRWYLKYQPPTRKGWVWRSTKERSPASSASRARDPAASIGVSDRLSHLHHDARTA